MTHPEIPKDHPRFKIVKEGENKFAEFFPARWKGEWQMVDELTGLDRQDCAAHAAAWWFEYAEKAHLGALMAKIERLKIARAWLAWGAEK